MAYAVTLRRHKEAAAIPTHRSSLLAQEAGMAGLRGGSSRRLLRVAYRRLTDSKASRTMERGTRECRNPQRRN